MENDRGGERWGVDAPLDERNALRRIMTENASGSRPRAAMPLFLVIAALAALPSAASAAPPAAPSVAVPGSTVTDPRQMEFTITGSATDSSFFCKFEYMTDYFFCGDTGSATETGAVLYQQDDPTPPTGDATHLPFSYGFFVRPGTHTLTVTASSINGTSAPTTSASFTADWNERGRISFAVLGSAGITAFDSNGLKVTAGNAGTGSLPDALSSDQVGWGDTALEVFPLDVSIVDRQEPSTRTLFFCAEGNVTVDYRLANDDAAETPQTGSVDLNAAGGASYLGSSSPSGLPAPSFLHVSEGYCSVDAPVGPPQPVPQPGTAPPPGGGGVPLNTFTTGKPSGLKLPVTVPGPGVVTVTEAGSKSATPEVPPKHTMLSLKFSSATATGPGTVNVKLKLARKAKKRYKQGKTVKVQAAVSFTPTGGTANTTNLKLSLKK